MKFEKLGKRNTVLLEQVLKLQNSLAFLPRLIAEKQTESSEGFLMSLYDLETLQDDAYTVYTLTEGEKLYAFLISYTNETFHEKHPHTEARDIDPQNKDCLKKEFVYIDQIGVDPESRGLGAGKMIYGKFAELHKGLPIAAAVLVKPVNNLASHKFFLKNGFKKTATFYTAKLKGASEVVGTFYVLASAR